MARKKRRKKRSLSFDHGLEQETVYGILTVISFVIGIFLILSSASLAGPVGARIFDLLSRLLGVGYFLLPLLAFIVAIALLRVINTSFFGTTKTMAAIFFFISGLGFIELVMPDRGGLVGKWINYPLVKLFDTYASGIILIALFVISVITLFDTKLDLSSIFFWRRWRGYGGDGLDEGDDTVVVDGIDLGDEEYDEGDDYEEDKDKRETPDGKVEKEIFSPLSGYYSGIAYVPPPLKLLGRDRGRPGAGDIKANANIIKRTLTNFGITVEVEEVTVGPTVTRYALKPAEGVRLSKILSLQNNLELALAAHPVRIEAPIPGKSLVGIEIPNSTKTTVGLGALLASNMFRKSTKPLFFALGRSVSGITHGADLDKMPHLLIAGATGAGKSVAIHTLVTSLLYRNSPEQLKLIMVDPKRVELTLYNGIPHLLTPVITNAKKTVLALKWLIEEMDRRYDVLEKQSVRDVASYHRSIVAPALKKLKRGGTKGSDLPEPMPYIIVVIDELADIMSAYPRELEAAVVRLAQMSRAVGIHLVLSTQRPSVNVITGLIKANVPARVALQVSSQVDSRTILDMSGAEKLLGSGDMLFISAEMSKPIRIQGGYISEKEVKRVVDYLKKNYDAEELEELDFPDAGGGDSVSFGGDFGDEEDELYEDARETVIEAGKASTSYLQRKLRVGYARAARLIDMLEERGVVGPADGSRPRDVLEGVEGYGEEGSDEKY